MNDSDLDELIVRLRNGTQLGRFNPAEVKSVFRFIEDNGYSVAKVEPVKIIESPVNAAVEGADAPTNPAPLRVAKPVKAKAKAKPKAKAKAKPSRTKAKARK